MTIIRRPNQPALFTGAEQKNGARNPAAPSKSQMQTGLVSEVIRAWAAHDPDRLALLSEDGRSISYGQLITQIDTIRAALNDLHDRPPTVG